MSGGDWIVCEQSNRWAAALRMALDGRAGADGFHLREVRSLAELSASLSERPASVTCIEIQRTNLSDALTWLASAERSVGPAPLVALVSYSLQPDPWESGAAGSDSLRDIADVLREAGSAMVVTSPRRLTPLVELGLRQASRRPPHPAADDAEMPLASTVWASLPWQAG
jgi:hypothetical protein